MRREEKRREEKRGEEWRREEMRSDERRREEKHTGEKKGQGVCFTMPQTDPSGIRTQVEKSYSPDRTAVPPPDMAPDVSIIFPSLATTLHIALSPT
jgi:hypothetical protein